MIKVTFNLLGDTTTVPMECPPRKGEKIDFQGGPRVRDVVWTSPKECLIELELDGSSDH
jgi:hypothetical protein